MLLLRLLLRLQRGRSVGNKLSGCSERALLVLEGTGNKVVVHVVSRGLVLVLVLVLVLGSTCFIQPLAPVVIVVIVVHDSRVLCDIPRGSVYRIRAYTRQAARQRVICDRMH